jgi:hypothetical protein
MSKFIAFVAIVVLLGAIFYVYDLNTHNAGVKIDKLKLKYTIGENATSEKMISFSQDLSSIAGDYKDKDKTQMLFESNFWNATGLAKETANYLSVQENYADNCTTSVKDMKENVKTAKQNLNDSKIQFELIKDNYSNVAQDDYYSRFSSVEYSLQVSEDLLYVFCPE